MNHIKRCKPALGTYVTIALEGTWNETSLLAYSDAAFEEIQRIEDLMNFHNPESELSHLNREAHLRPVPVSSDMVSVLTLALRLSQLTDGDFDLSVATEMVKNGDLPNHGHLPHAKSSWRDLRLENNTVSFAKPMLLDLGGIAKGYAVDRAFSIIPKELSAVVDAGGDLRMRPWRGQSVFVRIPEARDASLLEVPMWAQAVATSAGYFRNHPVICPATRKPLRDKRSVSVFAPSCMLADALTKVVFLSPESEPLLRLFDAAALIVEPGGNTHWKEVGHVGKIRTHLFAASKVS